MIAEGRLIVESSVKKVQHPTGGVVGELLVREGQHVRASEVVLRLDQTQTLASLEIIRQGLDELKARQARDRAEQEGATTIVFPAHLEDRHAEASVSRLLIEEQSLLRSRTASRAGQKAQSTEQIAQLEGQMTGLNAQLEAKATETRLNERELAGVQTLWEQRLIQYSRLAALQAEGARLKGETGRLTAGLAEVRGRIAEIRLKILQIDQDMRTDVGKELADLRGLSKMDLFKNLSAAALSQVAETMQSRQFRHGDVLVRQGERGEYFFLLRRGDVDVHVADANGSKIVSTLESGAYFGERALITGDVRNATIIARGDGVAYALDKAALQAALDTVPSLQDQLRTLYFARQ